MKLKHGYVIVGAGIAGLTAAMSIRAQDKNSVITLINGETYPPYKRTNLSKYLALGFEEDAFTLADRENLRVFYRITLVEDTISRIDYPNKLATGKHKNYAYDYLILATGACYELDKIFGDELQKSQTLRQKLRFYRNKSETFALQQQFADLFRVAVLGGGVQGIETCYELLKRGKKVSLLDSHDSPLARLRSPYISAFLKQDLETRGVDCRWGQRIESVSELRDFELIICCIGTRPLTRLFPPDATPQENLMLAPDVFACGDNFCYPSSPERCGLWHEAMDLGQLAGSNVAKLAGGLSPAQLPKLERKPYRTKIEVAGKVLFLAPPITEEQPKEYQERHFCCEKGYYQFFLEPPDGAQLAGAALLCKERELLKPLQQAVWAKLDYRAACQTLDIPMDSEFDGRFPQKPLNP